LRESSSGRFLKRLRPDPGRPIIDRKAFWGILQRSSSHVPVHRNHPARRRNEASRGNPQSEPEKCRAARKCARCSKERSGPFPPRDWETGLGDAATAGCSVPHRTEEERPVQRVQVLQQRGNFGQERVIEDRFHFFIAEAALIAN
jgi:hypothetical protein